MDHAGDFQRMLCYDKCYRIYPDDASIGYTDCPPALFATVWRVFSRTMLILTPVTSEALQAGVGYLWGIPQSSKAPNYL